MNRALIAMAVILCATLTCVAAEVVVTSTRDTGQGTFRWALQSARSGDTITFDPAVFPPSDPATIYPRSELPPIERPRARITIDASNAGVIIDGADVPGDWNNGLQIYADDCVVMGLQIRNFKGSGITACSASRTRIGGSRSTGAGPTGQGNLVRNNGIGIDLCSGGTENVIEGNIIGTDLSLTESWGNTVFGISIEDGLTSTTVGPGNVFADNRIGIDIAGAQAYGNSVTQNLFHRSTAPLISLRDGGNSSIAAPSISFIDPEHGVVRGEACRGCVVEIYSFDEEGWSVFEGAASADDSGLLLFEKGAPLSGTAVVALATDHEGNSAPLPIPFEVTAGMQAASEAPLVRLETFPSAELADNRIGAMFCGLSHPYYYPEVFSEAMIGLGDLQDLGFKRVRFSINDLDWPTIEWGEPELPIHPRYDAFVDSLVGADIELTYVLTFWDKEWVSQGNTLPAPRFRTEAEVDRYAEFVRGLVSHFKGRVDYYEIWNEPGHPTSIQSVGVDDYLELARRGADVIKTIDGEAKVVVGGTTYPFFAREAPQREYMFTILESDIMTYVDGIAWHGMYGTSPEHEYHRQYYYEYPSLVREIRDTATDAGFSGTYVADELNWQTPDQVNPNANWPNAYSEEKCSKYYARGIIMNLGMDFGVSLVLRWQKPLWYRTIQNLCTVMAGHESIDIPVEIAMEYDGPVAYCAFRYPNGDRMLAAWTDGVAQDEDPGVPATITFQSLAAGSVTGIDVVHGFEQKLTFEIDGEDTIVRDLLVKDYPILIRLGDIPFGPDYEETVGDGFHRFGGINVLSAPVGGDDRDGDGVPDEEDWCPDYPGSKEMNGC